MAHLAVPAARKPTPSNPDATRIKGKNLYRSEFFLGRSLEAFSLLMTYFMLIK